MDGETGLLNAAWDIVSGMWAFGLGVVACLLFLVWCWLFRREIDYSFRKGWQSLGENAVFFFINALFGPVAFLLSTMMISGVEQLGIPRVDPAFWTALPAIVVMIVGVFVYDITNYWFHRGMHEVPWLWPIHAIHHSDEDVNGLTTYRVHFIEPIMIMMPFVVVQTLLGISPASIAVAATFLGLHNIYVHIDLDWTHGPLRYIIASPRYHRWHHADIPEAHGKNLANFFPFIDVWFGTYYVPGKCEEKMGADGVPKSIISQMAFPFTQWWQMGAKKMRRRKVQRRTLMKAEN
ncbi:MAG: sterol desaturase family protein [Ahrensia sp.]